MYILENMRSKVCIIGRLIISLKFFIIWMVKKGGRGSRQMVTNSDKGGKGAQKSEFFTVTFFLMAPHTIRNSHY